MAQLYANNAFGTLSQPLAADGTSLVLQVGEGARFPLPSGGDFFLVTLAELNDVNNEVAWEIRRCTARVGDTLTVTQAQEGTAPRAWVAGTRVDLRDTAGTLAGMAEKAALGTAATKDAQINATDNTAGRLMAVGAFGIGLPHTAIDNLDCNSIDPSIQFIGVPNGNSLNGPPNLQYFYIQQFTFTGGNRTQLAIPYKTNKDDLSPIWFRGYFDTSGWSPWQQLWDSANLNPASFATAAQGAKADSALQSEIDPTVPAWAKAPSKPSYTKAEVELGDVDNTSDADKPVSTAQQAALDLKAALSGGSAANFGTMPQVGGSPIVEFGSNANGNYIKFADGTMICWLFGGLIPKADTVTFQSSWTFPVAFTSIGAVMGMTAGQVSATAYANHWGGITLDNINLTWATVGVRIIAGDAYTIPDGTNITSYLAVIGRWK